MTTFPTDSISPASSTPKIGFQGLIIPKAMRAGSQKEGGIVKLRILKSATVTVVARTFTSTSWSLGTGFSTSANFSTSGSPYFVQMTAFISMLGDRWQESGIDAPAKVAAYFSGTQHTYKKGFCRCQMDNTLKMLQPLQID